MLRTDELLLRARKWKSKTMYTFVNEKTGCYGVAAMNTPRSRPNLTIHHGLRCECLDVHLIHIHKHANIMYKRNGIRRGRRDDLIMAIKLRLPNMGITVKMPKARKSVNPEEAGDCPINVVEETKRGQKLVETWQSVEAWKNRKIWKDW
ncbi:hypothetical protein F4677DRAFT_140266 [Hypoxylon crocopeplum]|nr:hypothetical protein F4677DRAFT_140266 [Hypoxylon crocopeplum]